ncbi:MAG TPA: DUF4340 domain-containing protein [Phycisphaerales bacterium]|nr:DUF4340 domain-containing protein [Phycisphaerales bacterium]
MNTKTLATLVIVTGVLAAGAYFVTTTGGPTPPRGADPAGEGRPLFPDAPARAKDAAKITIQRGEKKVVLARAEGGAWGLADRGNYPALEDKVRETARGVLDAREIEKKTADPALHGRIGLEDPAQAGATSTLVSIEDGAGKPIAALIIGKRQDAGNYDPAKAATFVRPAGENQTSLVRGTFNIGVEPVDWIRRDVLTLDAARFARVEVARPGGEAYSVSRKSRLEESYVLEPMPAGRELVDTQAHARVLHAPTSINIDDARLRSDIFTEDAGSSASTYTTFDGLVFAARSVQKDGGWWVNVTCAFDPAKITDQPAPDEAKQEALKKEASEIDARLAPWAFKVSEYTGKNFAPAVETLLKPAAPVPEHPAQPSPTEGPFAPPPSP